MPLLKLAQGQRKRRVKNMFENNDHPGDIMEKNGMQVQAVFIFSGLSLSAKTHFCNSQLGYPFSC